MSWGTQATTTGGTEDRYMLLNIELETVTNIVTDIRVSTGSTNVVQGLRLDIRANVTSTAATWEELDEVESCS